jgi:glycosyltransferase involved in cell wall biosynthesis
MGLGTKSRPVLQVVTSTDRRGAETFAVELGAELEHLGQPVTTVALARGTQEAGLDVPVLGRRARSPQTLGALRRASAQASVVIAHGSTTLSACAIALAVSRVPLVYRNIGDPTFWSSPWPARARTTLWLRRANTVVALTEESARVIRDQLHVPSRRLEVIPTGVSAARHRPATTMARAHARATFGLPEDAVVGVIVGALSPEKDVDLAIRAVAELPGTHLLVCGDGPERAALEAAGVEGAPGRVHFTGALNDPDPAYAAADVVVLSSRTEGLPAVLIEAGLRELPVATCDVGYVRDIVADGVTGFLAKTHSPGHLADAIRRAASLGSAAGIEASRICEARFELGAVAERWDRLLQRVAVP